jgi:hypothetical protein
MAVHRAKIRELMVEKENYTQRYLEEKQKYDELLAKVSSTSTLGSIILINQAGESSSGGNGTHRLMSVGAEARKDPLPDKTPQEIFIRPGASAAMTLSVSADCTSEQTVASPQAFRDTATVSQAADQNQVIVPTSTLAPRHLSHETTPESTTAALVSHTSSSTGVEVLEMGVTTCVRRERRGVRTAKKVIKYSGITLTAVVAVAFFPVTIGIYVYDRQRRKRRARAESVQHNAVSHSFSASHPQTRWQTVTHLAAPHERKFRARRYAPPSYAWVEQTQAPQWLPSPHMYDSSNIPAELPGPHELETGRVEMDLVGRLVTYNNLLTYMAGTRE